MMIYVFLAGVLGFLVFDAYRIHKIYSVSGRLELTFDTLVGIVVHMFVYAACGILGIFVNIDVLGVCCEWTMVPEFKNEMVVPILRSFALGLAGPAGLSKGETSLATNQKNGNNMDYGDLAEKKGYLSDIKLYIRIILMR